MRVQERKSNEYPWWLRLFFWRQKKKYGQLLKPALLWGRSPKLFVMESLLYRVIERKSSPIPAVLRSLVMVRVSQINQCSFCIDLNSANLLQRTGSMNKADALSEWRERKLFDAKEKACLEYAEAMTDSNQKVTDEMITQLRQHFNDDGIVELTAIIAFQNLSSKFNSALDIPLQGFCQYRLHRVDLSKEKLNA